MTTTTEGTGIGSVTNVKKPIYNGVVKPENLDVDILEYYEGNVNLTGNLSVDGNIISTGYIRSEAEGQILNTKFFIFDNGEVSNGSNTYTDFASVTYTPVSSNSNLLIEYHATYAVDGAGDDIFRSRIMVGATEITWRTQSWVDLAGGGTRSAVLFPISMVYENSVVTSLVIKISAARDGSDDTLTVNTDSAYLRITEVSR
jgi:hypothetical protein